MIRLRPFFGYYGSKWRLAPRYPPPEYPMIIEPFAGAAGYSLFHYQRDVLLNDSNEVVAGIWERLIHGLPGEILKLGDNPEEMIDECYRDLAGFWMAKAPTAPRKTMTPWAAKYPNSSWWGSKIRRRIAEQMPRIRHWRIQRGDYRALDNVPATWFVDPPYQHFGKMYPHGSTGFDYEELASWCGTRLGQVIVCEGTGATWLPFEHLVDGRRPTGAGEDSVTGSVEKICKMWAK
jgi:site-specific DNA-adenine methylase